MLQSSSLKKLTGSILPKAGIFYLSVLLIIGTFSPTLAAPTKLLNYQARITDPSGESVSDGSYSIVFRIYNVASGGSALWTETNEVSLEDGILDVRLGNSTPINLDFNTGTYYLGVTIEDDSELSPRRPIGAAPFALNSSLLDGRPIGTGPNDVLALDNSSNLNLPNNLNTNGNTAIGGNATIDGSLTSGLVNTSFVTLGTSSIGGTNGRIRFTGTDFEGFFGGVWHSLTQTGADLQGSEGQIAFFDDTDTLVGDDNFFFDQANSRLGIGTNNPAESLDVVGDALVSGDLNFRSGTAFNALFSHSNTANRVYTFPNKSGTVALLDDITGGVSDHGLLTGLGDDDHPQYFLLAGRSGGQIGYGGISAGQDLTLLSTSDATKGHVLIGTDGSSVTIGSGTGDVTIPGTGVNSTKIGLSAAANNLNNIAIGTFASATGSSGNIAIGSIATTSSDNSIAIGVGSTATASRAITLGFGADSGGVESITIGEDAAAGGANSIALGSDASASGALGIAIGDNASASSTFSMAFGALAVASGLDSIAFGLSADATDTEAVALGIAAQATGLHSTALGSRAEATGLHSIALGDRSKADEDNSLVIGNDFEGGYDTRNVYVGYGRVSSFAPGSSVTFNATGGLGTDVDGADLQLAGGRPTGSGNGGEIRFLTAPSGASSSSLQTLVTRWIVEEDGHIIPGANDTYDIGSDSARVRDLYLGAGTLHVGTGTADEGTVSYDTASNELEININGTNIALVQSDGDFIVGQLGSGNISVPGSGMNSEQFGAGSSASFNDSIAVGNSANTTGIDSVAVGNAASAGMSGTAIGRGASSASEGVALGRNAMAGSSQAVALGRGANAAFNQSIAIGYDSETTGMDSVAIGTQSTAAANSVALGFQATAASGQFVVGSDNMNISNVYFGGGSTEASPQTNVIINATGGSGTNIAATNLILAGGRGTGTGAGGDLLFQTASPGLTGSTLNPLATRFTIDDVGNVVVGTSALTASATDGFLYFPQTTGAPSGTPTTYSGRVPMTWDATGDTLYVYEGGTWHAISGGGGGISGSGNAGQITFWNGATSVTGENDFIWDSANNRLEIIDGVSGVTPHAESNLVIHATGSNGALEFAGPTNAIQAIRFTDTTGSSAGKITYRHTTDALRFQIGGSDLMEYVSGAGFLIKQSGGGIGGDVATRPLEVFDDTEAQLRLTFGASDFTDLQTNSGGDLLIEPSNSRIGMGTLDPFDDILGSTSVSGAGLHIDTGGLSGKIIIEGNDPSFELVNNTAGVDEKWTIFFQSTLGYSEIVSVDDSGARIQALGSPIISFNNSSGDVGIGTSSPNFKLGVVGSIGPEANDTYDLGSDTLRFRDIYLGPGSMHIGTSTADEGSIFFNTTTDELNIAVDGTTRLLVSDTGNFVQGTGSLSTSATNGFPYMPSMAGVPTGTPTSYSGRVPMTYDTSSNTLYVYNGGWQAIGGGGGGITGTGAAGQVTYWTGASAVAGHDDLFWDAGDLQLGIGNTTPRYKLDVATSGSSTQIRFGSSGDDNGGFLTSWTENNAYLAGGAVWESGDWIAKAGSAAILGSGSGPSSTRLRFFVDDGLTPGNTFTPTERMTITETGNVGINDTTPDDFRLQVGGSIGPTTNNNFDLGSDSLRWRDLYLGASGGIDVMTIHLGSSLADEATFEFDTDNDRLEFGVDGTARMVINDQGQVGIGTTDPIAKFAIQNANTSTGLAGLDEISQDTSFAGVLLRSVYEADTNMQGVMWTNSAADNYQNPIAGMWAQQNTGGSELRFGTSNDFSTGVNNFGLVIGNNGQVAVGSSTDTGATFNVWSGGANYGDINDLKTNANNAGIRIQAGADNDTYKPGVFWSLDTDNLDDFEHSRPVGGTWLYQDGTSTNMIFGVSDDPTSGITNVVMIDEDGDLGIGYDTPADFYPLDAKSGGTALGLADSAGNYLVTINPDQSVGGGTFDVIASASDADQLWVGRDTSENPTSTINGAGDANFNTVTETSDQRLKKNISPVLSGLDVVNALNPVTYDFITGKKNQSGFIAQEVQKILPGLVSKKVNGYLSLNYSGIIPYVVKATKELNVQVVSIKNDMDSLKVSIADLKNEVAGLKGEVAGIKDRLSAVENKTTDNKSVFGKNVKLEEGALEFRVELDEDLDNTNYSTSITPNWNTNFWITDKNTSWFNVHFGVAAPKDSSFDYIIVK